MFLMGSPKDALTLKLVCHMLIYTQLWHYYVHLLIIYKYMWFINISNGFDSFFGPLIDYIVKCYYLLVMKSRQVIRLLLKPSFSLGATLAIYSLLKVVINYLTVFGINIWITIAYIYFEFWLYFYQLSLVHRGIQV